MLLGVQLFIYETFYFVKFPMLDYVYSSTRKRDGGWTMERSIIEKTMRKLLAEKEGEKMRDRALKLIEKENLCFKQGGLSWFLCLSFSDYALVPKNLSIDWSQQISLCGSTGKTKNRRSSSIFSGR